jgi:hypothetical protein
MRDLRKDSIHASGLRLIIKVERIGPSSYIVNVGVRRRRGFTSMGTLGIFRGGRNPKKRADTFARSFDIVATGLGDE